MGIENNDKNNNTKECFDDDNLYIKPAIKGLMNYQYHGLPWPQEQLLPHEEDESYCHTKVNTLCGPNKRPSTPC